MVDVDVAVGDLETFASDTILRIAMAMKIRKLYSLLVSSIKSACFLHKI